MPVKIFEHALQWLEPNTVIGLGSGRASLAFVEALGERVREGFPIRGVATSHATAERAVSVGIALVELGEVDELAIAVDGADEVDPHLNLIKGYGRALVREKVVAVAARKLLILVGQSKLVPQLGTRGKLPVEVLPFALPICLRHLRRLNLEPVPFRDGARLYTSDNGNHIVDCATGPIDDPARLAAKIREIPGVIDSGLFIGMTDVVLVGDDTQFELTQTLEHPRVPTV
jgi:ribose 5-phosphate isomerase A